MSNTYNLSDGVIARLAQILQEAMLLGVDVIDIMRQIKVTPNADGNSLILAPEYIDQVKASHEKLIAQAEKLHAEQEAASKNTAHLVIS